MHPNFIIADFMGEERCRCCDFGWDGVSRQISQKCYKCDKPHMASSFPYDTDMERMEEVLDKLRERGYQTFLNNTTEWSATISDVTATGKTMVSALHLAVSEFLNQKRVR